MRHDFDMFEKPITTRPNRLKRTENKTTKVMVINLVKMIATPKCSISNAKSIKIDVACWSFICNENFIIDAMARESIFADGKKEEQQDYLLFVTLLMMSD